MSLPQAGIGKQPKVAHDNRRRIRNATIVAAAVLMCCGWAIPAVAQDRPPYPVIASAPGAAADSDGDGLADAQEIMLGTDPASVDSDCDLKGDLQEVDAVTAPADSDQR